MVFCFCQQVTCKLTNIKIVSNKIVYLRDFTLFNLFFNYFITSQSFYGLSPYFSRQRMSFRCSFIPMTTTFQQIWISGINTDGYIFRNLLILAFLYIVEDIGIATFAQEFPNFAIGLKGVLIDFLGGIHQERYNGVTPNIFCYVFFGVICSHGSTVVDVLFEDVTKHIWIDILATGS